MGKRRMTTLRWSGARSNEGKVLVVVGPWVVYALAFLALYGVVGPQVSVLVLIPVALVAGLTGMRAGLLAGIIAIPLNLLLARFAGDAAGAASVGGPAAIAAPAVLGAAIGWLRDLADEPHRRQAESRRIDDEVNRRIAERAGAAVGPMMPESAPQQWAQYVGVLVDQCMRMAGAVDSVVRLSHLEGEKESASFIPLDLNEVVDSVVVDYQGTAQSAGLLLMFEPHRGLPKVRGAGNQLVLMVSSLLDNAIDYTETGVITVSTEHDGDWALLNVEDTGCGMAPDALEQLLERLEPKEPEAAPDVGDSGLGLRIVREVVDLHGGKLGAASTLGEGTTFTVRLPLATSLAGQQEPSEPAAVRTAED
jgi:signal transduction histidine kinase